MADCPAGSHIKPALAPLQWIIPDALCGPLLALTPWDLWLGPLCAALAPRLVRIDELCTSPPPVYPEIDPVTLAEQGQLHVWSKNLDDWIWAAWVNANWAVLCECLPVTSSGSCALVAPFGGTTPAMAAFAPPIFVARHAVGHDWTSATIKATCTSSTAPACRLYVTWSDAAFTVLRQEPAITLGPTATNTATWSASMSSTDRHNVKYLELWMNPRVGESGTFGGTLEVLAWQGPCVEDTTVTPPPPSPEPAPPAPTEPAPPAWPTTPCTPDDQCKLLYDVLRQLQRTGQLVELLQRFGLPFATIPGLLRGPFTGAGSFTVADLAGMQVDLQPPLPVRQLEGTPAYVWDAGWMSIMTGDGMIEERRITRDTQVWQPRMIQEATTFGYFLKSGVSATFRELKPEPAGPNLGGP